MSNTQCDSIEIEMGELTSDRVNQLRDESRCLDEKDIKAFRLIPEVIALTRLDGTFLEVNDAFFKTFGFSRDEVIGKTSLELGIWVHNQDRQRMVEEMTSGDEFTDLEVRFRHKKGNDIYVLMSGKLVNYAGVNCFLTVVRDITERKQMEEALRQSEQKFSEIFALCPDPILILRVKDRRYLDVNTAFLNIGYSREEVVGKREEEVVKWIDSTDRERMEEEFSYTGGVTNRETRFYRKNGQERIYLVSVRGTSVEEEECFLAFGHDITEIKYDKVCEDILRHISMQILTDVSLDEVLNYACEQLVNVFDLSMVWINLIEINGAQKPKRILRNGKQNVSNWQEVSECLFSLGTVLQTGTRLIFQTMREMNEELYKGQSGVDVDQRENGSCLVLPLMYKGETISTLGLISRFEHFWDRRMVKRMEKFIDQLAIAVKAAENRQELNLLHSGLKNAMCAISIADHLGNIEWVNQAFAKISGYDYAELIGQNIHLLRKSPDDSENVDQTAGGIWETLMAGNSWQGELTLRRKDHSCLYAETVITPIKNDQGEEKYISFVQDITEQKIAREAIVAAREATAKAEKLFSLGVLSAGICHEIGQPLNFIKMVASGITYNYEIGYLMDVDEIMPRIEEIVQQADRIQGIVSQLRSMIQRGNVPVERCDLNALLEKSLIIYTKRFNSAAICLQRHLADGLPMVLATSTALECIIDNLIINAMQAFEMVDRREKVIIIRTHYENDVVLMISDNGPGIKDELGAKIFDPLFSSKLGGDNLGLGLAIVHSLVTSYDGAISYESDGSTGTTFTVKFPVAKN